MTVGLLWFRRNLRLSDNSPLTDALERAEAGPGLVHRPAPGAQGPGLASLSWLNGSLASLDVQLREHGSALTVRTGMPPAVLASLAEETGARTVHCERDWTPEALAEERAVGEALAARGVALAVTEGQLLVTPRQARRRPGEPTAYSRRSGGHGGGPGRPPIRHLRRSTFLRRRGCRRLPGPTAARRLRHRAMAGTGRARGPGAAGGVRRQRPGALRRPARRPALRGTSELSPRLSWGEITPPGQQARQSAQVTNRRALPSPARVARVRVPRAPPPEHGRRDRWQPSSPIPWSATAEACVAWRAGDRLPPCGCGDAALAATGWMHNRVRLVVASFLTKDLLGALAEWRGVLQASGSPTTTRRPTLSTGSGSPAAARTPPPTSGSSTPRCRARASIPKAPTCEHGCRNWRASTRAGSTGPGMLPARCSRRRRRTWAATYPGRSSITPRPGQRPCRLRADAGVALTPRGA